MERGNVHSLSFFVSDGQIILDYVHITKLGHKSLRLSLYLTFKTRCAPSWPALVAGLVY